MSRPTHCAHASCGCPPEPDSRYCGPYCANAAESEPLPGDSGAMPDACSCGHEPCRRAQERRSAGRETRTSVGDNP